jgi:hypothetical protein
MPLTLYTYHISKTSSTVRTACLLFLEFVHIIYLLHLRPYGASNPSLAKALIASYMYFFGCSVYLAYGFMSPK